MSPAIWKEHQDVTGVINLLPPLQHSCFTAISSAPTTLPYFEDFPSRFLLWTLENEEETSWGKTSFTLSFSTNRRLWEYCADAHRAHTYALRKIKEFTSNINFCNKSHKRFDGLKFQLETFLIVCSAYSHCDFTVHSIHSHTEKLQTNSLNITLAHVAVPLSLIFCLILYYYFC